MKFWGSAHTVAGLITTIIKQQSIEYISMDINVEFFWHCWNEYIHMMFFNSQTSETKFRQSL
jgi:hypothetical protein